MVVIEINDSEDIQQYYDIYISHAYCNYLIIVLKKTQTNTKKVSFVLDICHFCRAV